MSESLSSPGIDPPSPTLAARLRELADYLAAPAAGRLTEEQRALSLGIARRLVFDVAARLDPEIDTAALWDEWLRGGLPSAARLAAICFARAEEHRWREQSALRTSPSPILPEPDPAPHPANVDAPAIGEPLSAVDHAYLVLQIADRRRFDALGNPALAIADVDCETFRVLLLDIAAWWLARLSGDKRRAAKLGDAVRGATEQQAGETGMTHAGRAYHEALGTALPLAAAEAIARHDWPTLIALAASARGRPYDDLAMTLLASESAALPSLLAPLCLDRAALAPLEAALAMLPARPVADAGYAGFPVSGVATR